MTIGGDHECVPMTDPRHHDTCVRCGLPIAEPSGTRRRNIELEREITHEAAKGIVDPDALILFAETRARSLSGEYVDEPSLVLSDRDRQKDGREELSDCRNHLVWGIQECIGTEKAQRMLFALRHVCLAYDLLLEDE